MRLSKVAKAPQVTLSEDRLTAVFKKGYRMVPPPPWHLSGATEHSFLSMDRGMCATNVCACIICMLLVQRLTNPASLYAAMSLETGSETGHD